MAGPFRTFSKEHSYISGLILTVVGLFGVYGSFSGNLAAMLAALFDPSDLRLVNPATNQVTIPAVGKAPAKSPGSGGTPTLTPVPAQAPGASNSGGGKIVQLPGTGGDPALDPIELPVAAGSYQGNSGGTTLA